MIIFESKGEPTNMLSSQQAAKYLGISNITLHRWRKSGNPRIRYRIIGIRPFYEKEDLDRYLEGTVIEPEGESKA
jgi:predicted site-specific integrase-resolvase